MVMAILRFYLPRYEEELCIKIYKNAKNLKSTYLDFYLRNVSLWPKLSYISGHI